MKYHALYVSFERAQNFKLSSLQIVCGALRVNSLKIKSSDDVILT